MIKTSTRPERRRLFLRPHHNLINRGEVVVRYRGMVVDRYPRQPDAGRSKYMPHIGAKQRAKGEAA